MTPTIDPPLRTEWLPLYWRLHFLEEIATKREVLTFHKEWHDVAAAHSRWFALKLRAHQPGRTDEPTEADRYVAALQDLAQQLQLRGSWCETALHQMIAGPRIDDTLYPIVAGAATETFLNPAISRSLTQPQARAFAIAQVDAEWSAGNLAKRSPRPGEIERNIRWLLWRLEGQSSRDTAACEARNRHLDVIRRDRTSGRETGRRPYRLAASSQRDS